MARLPRGPASLKSRRPRLCRDGAGAARRHRCVWAALLFAWVSEVLANSRIQPKRTDVGALRLRTIARDEDRPCADFPLAGPRGRRAIRDPPPPGFLLGADAAIRHDPENSAPLVRRRGSAADATLRHLEKFAFDLREQTRRNEPVGEVARTAWNCGESIRPFLDIVFGHDHPTPCIIKPYCLANLRWNFDCRDLIARLRMRGRRE